MPTRIVEVPAMFLPAATWIFRQSAAHFSCRRLYHVGENVHDVGNKKK